MKGNQQKKEAVLDGNGDNDNVPLAFSAVELALSDDDSMTKAKTKEKQKTGRTREAAETQPTQPLRRGQSVTKGTKGNTRRTTSSCTTATPTTTRASSTSSSASHKKPASRQSSFDARKWENRVSTQEDLQVKGDSASAIPRSTSTGSSTSTSRQSRRTTKDPVSPTAAASAASPTTIAVAAASPMPVMQPGNAAGDDIQPGAFRVRPAVGAMSAREYDANDDYNDALMNRSSHHNGSGSGNNNTPRPSQSRGMADRSEKDVTQRDAEDILIEATLVVAGDEAEGAAPSIIPEAPDLVTALPMTKQQVFDDEEGSLAPLPQSQSSTRVIGLLIVLLLTFLLVAGIVLGVQMSSKSKGTEDESVPLTKEVLPEYTQLALGDPSTPQSKAFDWYEKDLQDESDFKSYFPLQRFVLATFYYAMQGSQWRDQEYWLEDGTDPCDWHTTFYGVICTKGERRRRSLRQLERSAPRRHYQRLSLFQNNLVGTLPPELGLLSKLDVINLHNNTISGLVPSELGLLKDVTLLQLFENSLTSSLPTELGNLSQIRQLNFARNQLIGSLPMELSRLTTMEVFSVSNNQISGSVPTEYGQLESLEGLYLYGNPHLGGSLPSELGQIHRLEALQLNDVPGLTGTLPTELGLLRMVEEIQLQDTGVSGTMPSTLGQLTQLTRLALHDTKLTGSVPVEVCALVDSGVLQSLSVDCQTVKCSCNCDCTVSSAFGSKAVTETGAPQELITNPPIRVNSAATREPHQISAIVGGGPDRDDP